jgi:effector-binding domain-containing protein
LRTVLSDLSESPMDIVIKRIEPQRALTLRRTFSTWEAIPQVGREIGNVVATHRITPVGPPTGIYYGEAFKFEDFDYEFVLLVDDDQTEEVPLERAGRLQLRQLPAIEMAATHLHQGDLTGLSAKYALMERWAGENGYRLCGVTRIIHHRGPMHAVDPADYLTELQHEIEKAEC